MIPTEPGWYRTIDSSNFMLFALSETGQWSAHVVNGSSTDCLWGYIDQAGPIELVMPLK